MQNRRRESRAIGEAERDKGQKKLSLLGARTSFGRKTLYARAEKRSHSWKMGDHFHREESKAL
jgi:hypothetical protein